MSYFSSPASTWALLRRDENSDIHDDRSSDHRDQYGDSATENDEVSLSDTEETDSENILLGDPRHSLARCRWTKTYLRLAEDGHGYTFQEFDEFHGAEWALWCWVRCEVLNPVDTNTYQKRRRHLNQACHKALLCILRKQNDILIGRKVLTDPRIQEILTEQVQHIIASFISMDEYAVNAMMSVRTIPMGQDPWHDILHAEFARWGSILA